MNNSILYKSLAFLPIVSLLPISVANASQLYITEFATQQGAIVDTSTLTLVNTFTTGVSTETAIAVRDTVRILNGFSWTGAGSEYDLSGNVLNAGIYGQNSFASLYDGTTDGTYNYAIDHNGNGLDRIYRFDLNWQNPVHSFSANQRSSGITYDSNSGTLWTTGGSGAPDGKIQQYSLNGNLISEFAPGIFGYRYGIAFDASNNTLWTGRYGDGSSSLEQYNTAGVLLQQVIIPGLNLRDPFGMEFRLGGNSAVPDAGSSLALFGLSLGVLAAVRRK